MSRRALAGEEFDLLGSEQRKLQVLGLVVDMSAYRTLGNAVGDGVVYVHKRVAAIERNILFYILTINFQLVAHNLIVENELYFCKDTKVRANKFPTTVKKIQDDYLLYLSLFLITFAAHYKSETLLTL